MPTQLELLTAQQRRQWDQLLDVFRSFGGIADNVIQRPGRYGLGLFPIDPGLPSELRVPEHLLVPVNRITLRDGELTLKNAKDFPKGYAEWFSQYQANYSWGAEAQQNIYNFLCKLEALPTQFLDQLSSLGFKTREGNCTPSSPAEIAKRFIKTRQIWHSKGQVMMPILELVNHAPHGTAWDTTGDGIAVSGTFNNEILVRYSISDPLNRLMQYGFNCQEPTAFSVDLCFNHRGRRIIVDGGINNQSRRPCEVFTKGTSLVIKKPLMGSFEAPKLPLKLFKKSVKHCEVNSDELFDQMHHLNRIILVSLLKKLKGVDGDISQQLQTACLDQLVALSYNKANYSFYQQAT